MNPIIVIKNIKAPVELVFKTIASINEFSEAIPDIIKVEFLSETKSGVGTRFHETRLMKGKEATTELEVTEYVENESIRIIADTHGTVWDTLFTVKTENNQTILTMNMEAKTDKLFAKILNSLIRGMIAKAVEKDMDAVKVYCEK